MFDDEGLEVELASPWRRIAVFILNVALLFVFSIIIGFFLGFLGINIAGWDTVLFGYALILVYLLGQTILMAKTGQSLGKRIVGIQIIVADGRQPGLMKYVCQRELSVLLIWFILSALSFILGVLAGLALLGSCLMMMFFENSKRRTLQDMMADTLVIRI